MLRWRQTTHPPLGLFRLRERRVPGKAIRQIRVQALSWRVVDPVPGVRFDLSTRGDSFLLVGVNLSVWQRRYPGLVTEMAEVIWETGLDLTTLVLEITEGVAMVDRGSTLDVMRELKSLGLELTVDEFGAGYT